MTKLICVGLHLDHLILYEIYDGYFCVEDEFIGLTNSWVVQEKTTGFFGSFPKECFVLLSDWRNNQIDSILNDENKNIK